MQLNPQQIQILNHYQTKMNEEKNIVRASEIELSKVKKEYTDAVSKIHENRLCQGVIILIYQKVESMEEEAKLYKMIGPSLIPRSKKEITDEIKGRLKYFENYM